MYVIIGVYYKNVNLKAVNIIDLFNGEVELRHLTIVFPATLVMKQRVVQTFGG